MKKIHPTTQLSRAAQSRECIINPGPVSRTRTCYARELFICTYYIYTRTQPAGCRSLRCCGTHFSFQYELARNSTCHVASHTRALQGKTSGRIVLGSNDICNQEQCECKSHFRLTERVSAKHISTHKRLNRTRNANKRSACMHQRR